MIHWHSELLYSKLGREGPYYLAEDTVGHRIFVGSSALPNARKLETCCRLVDKGALSMRWRVDLRQLASSWQMREQVTSQAYRSMQTCFDRGCEHVGIVEMSRGGVVLSSACIIMVVLLLRSSSSLSQKVGEVMHHDAECGDRKHTPRRRKKCKKCVPLVRCVERITWTSKTRQKSSYG
jgi:hypothetical protein